MLRPAPPLSSLYFFAPESEEEKKLRLDMGFGMVADADIEEELESSAVRVETASTRSQYQAQSSLALTASSVPVAPPQIPSAIAAQPMADLPAATAVEARPTAPEAKESAAGTVNIEPVSLPPASRDPLAGFGAIATPLTTTEQPLAAASQIAPAAPVLQPVAAATAVSLSARHDNEDSDDEPLPELEGDLSDFYAEDGDDQDAGEDVDM